MSNNNEMFKRATGLLVIEVVNSNPNGDPDNDSMPRQRTSGFGEISPVSFKRKLRDLIEDHDSVFFSTLPEKFKIADTDENKDKHKYFIMESNLNELKNLKNEMGTEHENFTNSEFAKKYWDGRVFGNTLLEGNKKDNKEQDDKDQDKKDKPKRFIKTGVVQFGMGISLAPITVCNQTNTRQMPTEEGKQSGMAPLAHPIVEHGVYCMPFYINPNFAKKTGCTKDDVELLKTVIPHAYDLNRSTIRTDVRIRHAWYIEHKNVLCSCPEYLLTDALTPKKLGDANEPSASWADYEDVTELPEELLSRIDSCVDLMNL